MARLSASVNEETKNALYEAAEKQGVAVSHIVQAALDSYLGSGKSAASPGLEGLESQVRDLTAMVAALRQELASGPRRSITPRYF
ncbi:MAG: hypothetical protein AB7S38_06295 [Vulcanimicrobiota bacterium]